MDLHLEGKIVMSNRTVSMKDLDSSRAFLRAYETVTKAALLHLMAPVAIHIVDMESFRELTHWLWNDSLQCLATAMYEAERARLSWLGL